MLRLLGWMMFVVCAAALYMAVVVIADGMLMAGTIGLVIGVVGMLLGSRLAGCR